MAFMVESLERTVLLSINSYRSMISSFTEDWPNEVTGYIIGRREWRDYLIFSTHTVLNSVRRPDQVRYRRDAPIRRLWRLQKVWNNGASRSSFVGGFHAHVPSSHNEDLDPRYINQLSEADIEFILHEMKAVRKESWIELIVKFEAKHHHKVYPLQEKLWYRHRKLCGTLHDHPHEAYHVIISGYHLNTKGNITPVKIRLEKVEVIRKGMVDLKVSS